MQKESERSFLYARILHMNIVYFDIDGTLAKGIEIPASAVKALHQLRMNGNLIFICTGRPYAYAYRYFYPYANGFICFNGRYAHMGCCEVLHDAPVEKEKSDRILTILKELDAGYTFFDLDHAWYGGPEEGYADMSHGWPDGYIQKTERLSEAPVYAMDAWYRDEEHKNRIIDALQDLCLMNPHGKSPTMDATIQGEDKGSTLLEVTKKLNVPIENTYAFGDGVNDVTMLRNAGHGIAMGNAAEILKEQAEFVTDDIDKDGVMKGLKHFHLI
jgi:Cof subfamily protein (haloacid dehalogenase superfamily)